MTITMKAETKTKKKIFEMVDGHTKIQGASELESL